MVGGIDVGGTKIAVGVVNSESRVSRFGAATQGDAP